MRSCIRRDEPIALGSADESVSSPPAPAPAQQPPTETMEPAPKKRSPARVGAICDFLEAVFRSLKRHWKPSLDHADLARLGVECTALDLDAAAADFLRPVPLGTMTSWLEEMQPWVERGFGPPGDPLLDERWQAHGMAHSLVGYLTVCGHDRLGLGIMSAKTEWRDDLTDTYPVMHARSKRGCFDIEEILDYGSDGSLPHITAVLSQDTPLRGDELGGIELTCIIQLIFRRYVNSGYHRHSVIPVTLISAYGRNARVLHAHADAPARRIHVRTSRILDLDVPEAFRGDDWKRLLCWMLAEPRADVGTTFEQP